MTGELDRLFRVSTRFVNTANSLVCLYESCTEIKIPAKLYNFFYFMTYNT